MGTTEYVLAPLLAATAITVHLLVPPAPTPRWQRSLFFDGAVRDALRIDSEDGRRTAKTAADLLSTAALVQPIVIDNLLVTWLWRRAPRVAWQMFVINAQAYSLTFALNTLTKRITARERPWVDGCERDPALCDSGEDAYRSFYSGHAATTATSAGLICAHHTQLSLYGSDVLDAGACVTAVLGTSVTGALRIASDHHWLSDVLVGHLAGYLSGYLLPTLLYYQEFRFTPERDTTPNAPTFAVLPRFDEQSLQLQLLGTF